MTLIILALIPSIILLAYIYKKDNRDKESGKLLFKCFIAGIIITIPAILLELLIGFIFEYDLIEGSVGYAIVDGFLVAAFSEEWLKYLALKKRTWKSKEFNCSFDGIVYSVFVSLGFATFENVLYVIEGDISTAIARMITAVPGHAYDAVFMGYFYSKAKKAEIEGDKAGVKKNKFRALYVPILWHGTYDCLISFNEEVVGEDLVILGILLWIVLVAAQFISTFLLVRNSSKNDAFFVEPYPLESDQIKEEICK